MPIRRPLEVVLLWLLIAWLGAAARPAASAVVEPVSEEWFVVRIAETPVGWLRTIEVHEDGATVETQEMQIVLNRMGSYIRMSSSATTREDLNGSLLGVDYEVLVSSQATRFTATVEPGRISITDEAGDNRFDRAIAYEGVLLGPAGVRSLLRRRLGDVGSRISYRTFRPELGSISEISLEVLDRQELIRDGGRVPSWKVLETMAESPLQTTYWVDDRGRILRSSAPGPFGPMETIAADVATARLATGGGELPEESFRATLVPTQVRLREPRRSVRVVLELRHRNPDLGWPDLESADQRVLEHSPERVVLEVKRRMPSDRGSFPVVGDESVRPFLEANAYLQSDDSDARTLARAIVGETRDALEAGLALERWVAENMTFDMGVVMAPSSEVLVNRRGTCTEYAVLLTTLARSIGIPARFVMGYVYAGGIYGGHAWTEILIGEEWIGLDGAIVAEGPADAARFAFQWSSLDEGIGSLNLGPGVQLFGQIDLAVLEVETGDGLVQRFEPDAPLFTVSGDRYANEGLGVEWVKPAGFDFAELDATWPETGLVRLEGPDGRSAELSVRDREYWLPPGEAAKRALRLEVVGEATETTVAGRPAYRATGQDEAAMVWARGSELWLLRAAGPRAAADLDALAATLEL